MPPEINRTQIGSKNGTNKNLAGGNFNPKFEGQDEYFRVVKPIRTYERDLSELVRAREASQLSIKLEEEKKRKEKTDRSTLKVERVTNFSSVKKIAIAGLGFLAVLGIVLISLEAVRIVGEKQKIKNQPPPIQIESLVRGDSVKIIEVSLENRESLLTKIAENLNSLPLNAGQLGILHLVEEKSQKAILAQEFLSVTAPQAPQFLNRALDSKMTFGFLVDGAPSPFLILEVDSFDNVFAGMLAWEKSLASNLEGLISRPSEARGNFEDAIIRNRDLRVLRARNGETIILYSFLDNRHLLITDRENTFREVLERFLLTTR